MRLTPVAVLAAIALSAACSGSSSATAKHSDPAKTLKAGVNELTAGHEDAAAKLFKQVLVMQPGNVLAHYNLGVIYQGQNKTAQALLEYGQAVTADPTYVPALYNSATIYGNTDPTLAVTTYRKVVTLNPKAATAYLNLGLLEVGLNLRPQGLKDLETALRLDPTLVNRLNPGLKGQVGRQVSPPSPAPTATP